MARQVLLARVAPVLSCLQRRVVADVQQRFVAGIARGPAGEIRQVTVSLDDYVETERVGDLVDVDDALDRLEHHDDEEVVVNRLAIAAGRIRPELTRSISTLASAPEWRKAGETSRIARFERVVNRRNDNAHDAEVCRLLDVRFECIRHTN